VTRPATEVKQGSIFDGHRVLIDLRRGVNSARIRKTCQFHPRGQKQLE